MTRAGEQGAGPAASGRGARRRVLIVAYFYPPLGGGGVHRVLSFTRHLPEHGWDCTVVCAGEHDYWVRDESLLDRIPRGTEVIRVPGGSAFSAWLSLRRSQGVPAEGRRSGGLYSWLRGLGNWFLLPDVYRGWSDRAAAAVKRRLARGDVDALLTSSPPDSVHLVAQRIGPRDRPPWVADFRDPWTGLEWRKPPTAWHLARQRSLERGVLEGSDLVLTASRTHLERLGARSGATARRAIHLPNGWEPAPAAAEASSELDGVFLLAFTGTLSLEPDAAVLLDALHDVLARHPDARRKLRVRVAGAFDSEYEDRSISLGLKGIVEFAGPRPHGETVTLQRRADVLLLWKPRGFDTMVPGKLYEYLDAGRPILAVLDARDEAAALVRRANGEVVPVGDRAAIAGSIERRWIAWKAGERPARSRPEWLAEHSRERIAARLAAELGSLRKGIR